jgi:hypothetical protein
MNKLIAPAVLIALSLPACRGFQRHDSPQAGYSNALECVVVQGDTAERAAQLCSQRGFDPSVPRYREAFMSALECVRTKGGGAAEAAAACGQTG